MKFKTDAKIFTQNTVAKKQTSEWEEYINT